MKIASTRASLVIALLILGCQPAGQELPPFDAGAYLTNWTQVFKNAIKKAKENQVSVASQLGDLGYVPGLTGKCSESELGPVGLEAQHLIDDFHRNAQFKGKRNNIILQGDPGIDLDARVQTLAYLIAQGDCGLVESLNGRSLVLLDLNRLSQAAAAKKLPFAAYVKTLRSLLDTYRNKALVYINGVEDAAYLGGSTDDVLKVFIDDDTNVIIKSATQGDPDWSSPAYKDRVYLRKLEPIPSQTVVAALDALIQAQMSSKAVKISAKTNEDIVRLSRAFFSSKGALTVALQMFNLVTAYAQASANKTADSSMVSQAVLDLNEKFRAYDILSVQTIKDTRAWTDPLSVIDENVTKSTKYYADEHTRVEIQDAIKNSVLEKFANAQKTFGIVQQAFHKLRGSDAQSIAEKIESLHQAVQEMKHKIETSFEKGVGMSIYPQALETVVTGLDSSLKTIVNVRKRDLLFAKAIITLVTELLQRFGTLEQGVKVELDKIGTIFGELGKIPTLLPTMQSKVKEIIERYAYLKPDPELDFGILANDLVAVASKTPR